MDHWIAAIIIKNAIYNCSLALGSVDKADISSIYQPHSVSGHAPVTAHYCFTIFPELLSSMMAEMLKSGVPTIV